VGSLLPQAEYPVDFLRSRVIASDDFVGFCREIDFSFGDGQTVRGAQSPEVNRRQRLLRNQIDH
jgi:hypothetical protein